MSTRVEYILQLLKERIVDGEQRVLGTRFINLEDYNFALGQLKETKNCLELVREALRDPTDEPEGK